MRSEQLERCLREAHECKTEILETQDLLELLNKAEANVSLLEASLALIPKETPEYQEILKRAEDALATSK